MKTDCTEIIGSGRDDAVDAAVLAREAAQELLACRCSDVVTIDLRGLSPITDFYVIATAASNTQARGSADRIRKKFREDFELLPSHTEQELGTEWVIIDYYGVVVHIFQERLRRYYDLENLWKGKVEKYEDTQD